MKVCIGGTFDIIHKGHELLISKAFEIAGENGTVFIGVTKDDLIKNKKETRSFIYRKKSIEEFLEKKGLITNAIIKPIKDRFGLTINEDFDVIIVSPETVKTAKEINKIREKTEKKPIEIVIIPFVLADDGKPISSTRIKKGEIDIEGHIIAD
ncbi:MAG: cytidyltransferase [Thermoplasmata archaeon M9B1D]|nr:MAG: cytidyltransferase [Thermoplasmata archaeon M9B1D]PNX49964.1 MAG: cytidyltransferase [Thermoplasmata archaeon M8B2D]